mgnify:CR=1 FL=1
MLSGLDRNSERTNHAHRRHTNNLDHRSGNFVHPIETVLDNKHKNLKIILHIYHMVGFVRVDIVR